MLSLTDQIVLVTGAGRGLGRVMALAYAEAGADLVLAARRQDDLETAAAEVRARGRQAEAISADVRDEAQVHRLVERTLTRFGHVDVLVNNAGVGIIGPCGQVTSLLEIRVEDWDNVYATNLRGPFLLIRALLPDMLARGRGVIINVTSGLASAPRPGLAPYGGSKAALDYLTRALALEVADRGVSVYGLHPGGPVDTEFFRGRFSDELRARGVRAEVMGPAAVYLAAKRPAELVGENLSALEFNERRGLPVPWIAPRA